MRVLAGLQPGPLFDWGRRGASRPSGSSVDAREITKVEDRPRARPKSRQVSRRRPKSVNKSRLKKSTRARAGKSVAKKQRKIANSIGSDSSSGSTSSSSSSDSSSSSSSDSSSSIRSDSRSFSHTDYSVNRRKRLRRDSTGLAQEIAEGADAEVDVEPGVNVEPGDDVSNSSSDSIVDPVEQVPEGAVVEHNESDAGSDGSLTTQCSRTSSQRQALNWHSKI